MAIWKYDGNGNLDSTFGNNGIVVHHNAAGGDSADSGSAIVWDGAEHIYVTGYSYNAASNQDMVIWKYKIDGSLDTTFGSGGIVVHNSAAGGNYHDEGKAIVYDDATGHIYVTGSSWGNSPTNLDMVIWKYDSDGNLDSTFNSDGIVAHHNAADGEYKDYGYGIVLDSSGNIYVTGSSNGSDAGETTYLDMTIWKYSSTGILDNTFGNGGIVVHRNAAGGTVDDEGKSIVLDSDGNIYVTGHSGNGHDNDMVIWKYSSTGILDVTFDDDGIVVHDGAAGGDLFDYGYAIVLDSTENIYVTGTSRQASVNFDMVIWKYNSTGSLDNTFDSDGIVVHNGAAGGNGYDYGNAVVLDSTDNIYVTGFSTNAAGNWDMVIWKYK